MRAASDLLEHVGYAALTMDAVAAKAGVGKTTIYRRWPNRAALAMEVFLANTDDESPFPDTGSAREDFRLHLRSLADPLTTASFARVIAALVAETHYDSDLADAFLERYIAVRRTAATTLVTRGITRGELRDGVDPDVVIDALYGPLYYRLMVSHAPIDAAFTDALVEHVMNGVASPQHHAPRTPPGGIADHHPPS